LRREVYRKLIHLASVAVPVFVWFAPREIGLLLLGAAVFVALSVEWGRNRFRWFRYRFLTVTRTLLRSRERASLAGATHMAIAYLLALLIFPKPIAVAGMLYNALGDSAAALVGRRWGNHRTSWGKSWEGAAAGLSVNLLVGFLIPGLAIPAVLLGACAAATLEFLPLPIDDNPRVTLGGGAGVWLGQILA
jgi:dolichol kinase